jgi:hypothetical protein
MRITSAVVLFPRPVGGGTCTWLGRGWVRFKGTKSDRVFKEIDVARGRPIHDFRRAMAVPEDGAAGAGEPRF